MTETNQNVKKVRHDWYQTESQVVINILCKNAKSEDFVINYEPKLVSFVVYFRLPQISSYAFLVKISN